MISKRKINYPLSDSLRGYLRHYSREIEFPTIYDDLQRFSGAVPYEDPKGNETLWHTVMFSPLEMAELRPKLANIYLHLKAAGDVAHGTHLDVDRIDFGDFGNSQPFRVRIRNKYNDNFDHYYVKRADASRVYGLELEHILTPNRISYLVNGNTLIEEHIAGLPGDRFVRDYLPRPGINRVRIAKEFVKFNQRCFVRLLGDMRAVNYVVDITPDFEETQYRVRPIDFDRQSYDGPIEVYLAQFYDCNKRVVELVESELNPETIHQYKIEERTLIRRRTRIAADRLKRVLAVMRDEYIAPDENFEQLRDGLASYHQNLSSFATAATVGDLVAIHLDLMIA